VVALGRSLGRSAAALALIALLAACAPWAPAPVENRSERAPSSRAITRPQTPPAIYEVQRGDTLYSIAFRYGLDWRALAAWNRLDEPFLIRPGQELRTSEPPRPPPRPASRPTRDPAPTVAASSPTTGSRPPDRDPAARERERPATASQERARAPTPAASPVAGSRSVAGVAWRWPTAGAIARPFDPSAARRGLGIRGQAGQPVLAAAAGEVVYSGTALIGYGELIIIKHSGTMLSAYGHNRRRLVSEGVRVEAGQQIAEMGLDETDEAILHFEIRRNGDPENPLDFLPPRS
jgi:lipoprotein NlpD